MGKPQPIMHDHVRPTIELAVCIVCGMPGGWKKDRRGRAYLSCSHCQVRIFPHSMSALAGLELLYEMIRRMGVSRHRQNVLALVKRRVMRTKIPV